MNKMLTLCFWVFLCSTQILFAQTSHTLTNAPFERVTEFQVLADAHYSFDKILNDSFLPFRDSLQLSNFKHNTHYWYKCTVENPSPYAQKYYVSVFPVLDFTLYYYNAEQGKWISKRGGLASPYLCRKTAILPCIFQAKQKNTIYVKVKVAALAKYNFPVSGAIKLEKASEYDENEQYRFVACFATIAIMLMFFLYNLYIYFIFKDKTYLYYLVIVLGGIIYITAFNKYLNLYFSTRLFSINMMPNGNIYFYELNSFVVEIGIVLVLTGFIQLTRNYLQTFDLLNKWDKVLVYINIVFVLMVLSSSLSTISGFFYAHIYTSRFENISIVCIILLLFYVGVLSYRKQFHPAKYFLLANSLPLVIMIFLAAYLAIFTFTSKMVMFLPNFAILSQTLTFAVALVARINLLKEELKARQLEAQNLKNENEQMLLRAKLIELENENINAEMALQKEHSEKLQEKLDFNQRELASITLHIYQKNEMLLDLQKKIEALPQTPVHATSLKLIKNTIQNNLYLEADWDKFRLHFEQVHPDFFKDLLAKHPTLTAYEVRLCAYLHIQLSTKEIASLLNINPASVLTAKTRLNKKMNLGGKEGLVEQSMN